MGRAATSCPPQSAVVVARGLVKRYGERAALRGVDLHVRPGVVVGLVGPNGSGKTTTLQAIAGLVRVDAGTALVAGVPAGSMDARARIALVPDDPAGFDELTVAEYLALVRALYHAGGEAAARAEALVRAFRLEGRLRQRVGGLSRGLRRQAFAIAAMSIAPPALLIDEATATLDPEAVVVLREALRALARRGCGVLLATQDLHFAESVCDELVLLVAGLAVDAGTPAALRGRHDSVSLEAAFLHAIGEATLAERVRGDLAAL